MVKKAYMKTIEMVLVIVISTIFLVVIIPKQESISRTGLKDVLPELEENNEFREFSQKNNGCFNFTNQTISDLVGSYLENNFDYLLCINVFPDSVPDQNIYVETLYFAGNYSETKQKKIRLYYWINE